MLSQFAFMFLLFAFLAACAPQPDPMPTLEQQYYAKLTTYNILLAEAADYKQRCDARPVAQQTECRKLVRIFQAIDREAEVMFDAALEAVTSNRAHEARAVFDELSRLQVRLGDQISHALNEDTR